MRFLTLLGLSALSLVAAELHGSFNPHRHRDIAHRSKGDMQLHKRIDNSRWTFYDVGLGACGKVNQPGDFIVALNSAQFGGGYPGPNCFKAISMTYNGKSTQAVIMDECPGCPWGGLDLSRGLFTFFAPESVGVLEGTWDFVDGNGVKTPTPTPTPTPTSTKPTHTTTSTTPTSTHTTHTTTTTSTYQETSTTSSSTISSTVSKTTSKTSSSTTSTSVSSATPTPTFDSAQNLNNVNQAIIGMGGIVVAGEGLA
jgi:hypothetical protein